jgi:hypothetical protein
MTQALLLMLISLLPLTPVQLQDDLKAIQKLGQQCVTATIAGDANRLVDLTYPKVVEMMGGRNKMIAFLEKDFKEAKQKGYGLLPTELNPPTEVLRIGRQRFVILTYQMKMKVPGGILKQDSTLIGIVDKPGDAWTFVSGNVLDEAKIKFMFPAAADKLKLPARSEPVFEKAP